MKVKFSTAIDAYRGGDMFPQHLTQVPRKGDAVSVRQELINNYRNKNFPTTLEVVSVTWFETYALCELWYSQRSLDTARTLEVDLFKG